MTTSEAIETAVSLMQAHADLRLTQAIALSTKDHDTWEAIARAVLTAAGIAPGANAGPEMNDQLIAWEKATSRDDVIATMQRAAT